jgi:hypothetical protein
MRGGNQNSIVDRCRHLAREHFLSHPLVNTAMVVLPKPELERSFSITAHTVHLVEGA